ncbi:hypothetical protein R1flu_000546 [Riccia fluitans]|uniref:Uncharacterized protein n=1 Tax=Riccia fluitans TaxID=41844 RepID=A0ABD1Y137_9MARC
MGKDKKDKKNKTDDTKKFSAKTGLIDKASIEEYKSVYSKYQSQHGKEANSKLEAHVETRLHTTVEEQKKKRKRDITSVTASTAAGTAVPFSGIPIMVAVTMVQCVGFSASLGLIPIANVRSFQDVNTLASQMTSTLQKASSSGMKAAIEAFVLEVLKTAGIGYWLWEEILKDIVFEITSGCVIDSAWVLTPLFMAPKYYLHRKMIKKMYVSLGEKAIVVHKAWVNDHLFLGKPETSPAAVTAETTPTVPSAYQNGYPTTGQPMYQSNSEEGVPYPVYYQPAFASSTHRPPEANPLHNATSHSNSFPHLPEHPHHQYAYYPSSYPMHPPHGQSYPSSGAQHQPFYPQQYATQPGTYNPSSSASGYNHLHTNSLPHHLGSQAPPPTGYPVQHQNKVQEGVPTAPPQSYQGAYNPNSYPSAPPYEQQMPTSTESSHQGHPQSQPAYYNPSSNPSAPAYQQQQAPPSSHYQHPAQRQYTVQQHSQFPAGAEQKPHLKTSYGPPADHYHQSSNLNAALESYPQKAPLKKKPEAC